VLFVRHSNGPPDDRRETKGDRLVIQSKSTKLRAERGPRLAISDIDLFPRVTHSDVD
jgi:hypothetical protein